MRRARRVAAALALAGASSALWAPAASATFHLMLVREVYPGSLANPGSEYVELQMYAPGQSLVAGHVLRAYDANGVPTGSSAFASDLPNGANQSTIVMATPAAEAQFGIEADGSLLPADQLDPSGGAVCWENIDCVSWGSFSGSLPSPAGQPAAPGGIPDGMALRRTIAPNCGTLLEAADDRNDGALDFAAAFPNPRPNSVPPAEHRCASAPSGGPPGDEGAPRTRITRRPARRTRDRTPTFRFTSDSPGATFLCRLDRGRFRPCRSPLTTHRLLPGRHKFEVRALSSGGATKGAPAAFRFHLTRPHPGRGNFARGL